MLKSRVSICWLLKCAKFELNSNVNNYSDDIIDLKCQHVIITCTINTFDANAIRKQTECERNVNEAYMKINLCETVTRTTRNFFYSSKNNMAVRLQRIDLRTDRILANIVRTSQPNAARNGPRQYTRETQQRCDTCIQHSNFRLCRAIGRVGCWYIWCGVPCANTYS